MNSKVIVPIIIGVVALGIGVVLTTTQDSPTEVEDVLDRETSTDDEVPSDIQEKLDEINKINLENEYSPKPREWITSGPFQIDRSEYVLGEKIFLRIGGLGYDEKGQVAFMRPLNSTHYSVYLTVPSDGTEKNAFNYYIEPQLSKTRGLCSVDDVVGTWAVVFRGTDYPNLYFDITNQTLPGTEKSFEPVC